jgi:hypothetical protein
MVAKAASLAPWDIRPDESAKAYAAFAVYRDMGPTRTLETLCRVHTTPLPTLKNWSGRFGWVERTRAWDEHVIALANPRAAEAQAEALARHIQAGKDLQAWGAETLPKATVAAQATPADAIRAVKTGIDIERQGLGIPDRAPVDEDGKAVTATIAIIRMDPDAL